MKKQTMILLLSMAAALLLGGCSQAVANAATVQRTQERVPQKESQGAVEGTAEDPGGSGSQQKILIAYFTWADNTVVEDQEAAVQSAMAHYESMGDAALSGVDAISSASVVVPATVRDLKAALPNSATVLDPLGVYRADIMEAQPKVQEWLRGLGFLE